MIVLVLKRENNDILKFIGIKFIDKIYKILWILRNFSFLITLLNSKIFVYQASFHFYQNEEYMYKLS